jgi:hypothetical protein
VSVEELNFEIPTGKGIVSRRKTSDVAKPSGNTAVEYRRILLVETFWVWRRRSEKVSVGLLEATPTRTLLINPARAGHLRSSASTGEHGFRFAR